MTPFFSRYLPIIALTTLLVACARQSPPERVIALASPPGIAEVPADTGTTVRLERVSVPEYLHSYEVFSRVSRHELERESSSRWAERLPVAATRVLRAGLAGHGLNVAETARRVISVDIQVFEPTPGGAVVLAASWRVRDDSERIALPEGNAVIEEPVGGGVAAQAAAMERALRRLAAQIAEGLL